MKIDLSHIVQNRQINLATRCPHCGHFGAFIPVAGLDIYTHIPGNTAPLQFLGIRKCPNQNCNGHLFFIATPDRKAIKTFPSETIPFDKDNIPQKVLNAFEEAVKCHSNSCFIASAIMIRKTLEENLYRKRSKWWTTFLRN